MRARRAGRAARPGVRGRGWRPRPGDDQGSAIVEFLVLGVLLLVPLVYLIVALGRVQAAAFAVEGAARDGARVVATSADPQVVPARVQALAELAVADQGFSEVAPEVHIECEDVVCTTPQTVVRVSVRVQVPLPVVPVLVDRVVPTRVPVQATSVAVLDRFR